MNKLTDGTLGYFIIIYLLDYLDEVITAHLTEVASLIKNDLESLGIKLIDWRIDRESSIFLLNFYGDLSKKERVEKIIERRLKDKLGKEILYGKMTSSYGLDQYMSFNVEPAAKALELYLLSNYFKIFSYLCKCGNIEDISFFIEDDEELKVFFEFRKDILLNNEARIRELIDKWDNENFLRIDGLDVCVLYTIYSHGQSASMDTVVESLASIMSVNPKIINQKLSNFNSMHLIKINGTQLYLLDKVKLFLRDVVQIVNMLEKRVIRHIAEKPEVALNLLDKLGKKYVVRRSGDITLFSINKLNESLVLAGIDSSIAYKTSNVLLIYVNEEDFIPEGKLIAIVKRVLDVLDPTGESSLKYEFFINTRDKIIIKRRDLLLPFSYDAFQTLVKSKLLEKVPELRLSSSMLDMISTHLLRAVRAFLSLAYKDITKKGPIILEENYLDAILEKIMRESVPLYTELQVENKKKVISDILRDAIKGFKNVLGNARFNEIIVLSEFITAAKKLMWAILLQLDYWPHPNLISSASLISHIMKEHDIAKFDKTFNKRMEEFSRRVAQLVVQAIPSFFETIDRKLMDQIIELSKFGLRLSKQMLNKYWSS